MIPSFLALSRFALSLVRSTARILDFPSAASFKWSSYHLAIKPPVNQMVHSTSEKLSWEENGCGDCSSPENIRVEDLQYDTLLFSRVTFNVESSSIIFFMELKKMHTPFKAKGVIANPSKPKAHVVYCTQRQSESFSHDLERTKTNSPRDDVGM